MKRIFIDARPIQTYSRFRGIGRYVNNLKKVFFNDENVKFLYFYEKKQIKKALFIKSPKRFITLFDEYFLYSFLKKEKPSIFHSTGYMLPKKIKDISYIGTVYDLTQLKFKKFSNSKNRFIFKRILKTYDKRADIIITISESTKEDLIYLSKIDEDRVKVIYPYIKMPEIPHNFYPELGIPEGYIFYCGGFDPIKNVELLIRAIEFIDLPLVLAGKIDKKKADYYLSLIPERHRKKVYFTGFVDDITLGWLYKNALLFVYPSMYEGFGYPPLEALYYETKTLVSNIPVLKETLSKSAYFFSVDNILPNEFGGTIISVIDSKKLKQTDSVFYSKERFKKELESIWEFFLMI